MGIIDRIRSLGANLAFRFQRMTFTTLDDFGFAKGPRLSPAQAMRLPEIRQALTNIAEDISTLPLHLYRGDEKVYDHPAYRVLNKRANPDTFAHALRSTLIVNMLAHGIGACQKIRDRAGRTLELWNLDPTCLVVEHGRGSLQRRTYRYYPPSGRPSYEIPRRDLVLVEDTTTSPDEVQSRLSEAAQTIGLGKAILDYAGAYFVSQGRPSLLMEHATGFESQKDQDAAESAWNKQLASNPHGIKFLNRGYKVLHAFENNPEKAQALEARRYQWQMAAMISRVPAHMLGELSHGTYSNVSRVGTEYLIYTLRRLLVMLETVFDLDVLDDVDQVRGFKFKHQSKAFVRGDIKTQGEFYRVLLSNGIATINEVRELEDMPRIGGGDVLLLPLNMTRMALDGTLLPTATPDAPAAARDEMLYTKILSRLEAAPLSDAAKTEILDLVGEHLALTP